jgi:hypothetical protein
MDIYIVLYAFISRPASFLVCNYVRFRLVAEIALWYSWMIGRSIPRRGWEFFSSPLRQWVPGDLSLWVKWLGRGADHSPPSSAKVKNTWSCTSTPPIRLNGGCSVKKKQRDNLTFNFLVKTANNSKTRTALQQVPWVCNRKLNTFWQ